jgi:hypothetical protein
VKPKALAIAALMAALVTGATADVPRPNVVIARPGQCVADKAIMRRGHMDFLKHQRDQTVRQGIRTREHSLNECVACHAGTKSGSVLGQDGFCQSCHSYAAVRLDCFECHSAKPDPVAKP